MIYEGVLDQTQIAEVISASEQYTKKSGLRKELRHRFLYSLEEILLIYQKKLSEQTPFTLKLKLKNGTIQALLKVKGNLVDPFSEDSLILNNILRDFDSPPQWQYKGGHNIVRYDLLVYTTALRNMRLSWQYMRGQRGRFFVAVISQVLSIILSIVAPLLSAQIIVAYTEGTLRQAILLAVAIVIVQGITDFVLFVCNRSYNIVYNKTLSNLETDLVDGALHITSQCMEEKGTGLFIQRLTSDTNNLATGFNTMADLSMQFFNYIGILGAMFMISPKVFLLVAVLLAVQSWIEVKRTKRLTVDDRIYREANERYTGFIGEMVLGSTDVKLLNSEQAFKDELSVRINDANNKRLAMQGRSWAYKLTRLELGEIGYLLFMMILAVMIANGSLKAITAIVLFNYYSNLGAPAVLLLGELLEFIKDFNLSAERVYDLIFSPEFPKERFGTLHKPVTKGEIRFEHVSFAYENSNGPNTSQVVLKDMDFIIPAGSVAAFVGLSGAGKSTIFRLISKLYDVSSGTVYLDGIDIKKLDKESIRESIAVVTQKPYLFNMSIRDNLRLVKPDMTEEEMQHVCRLACIEEDILAMPDGYDTMIEEGGSSLSGGQCQRLAIARSLLRKFNILLLDEATSSLDSITQEKIKQALFNIGKDRTVVMIAHRLSTIIDADAIFYLEGGRVLDHGTHKELFARCRQYQELYGAENRG